MKERSGLLPSVLLPVPATFFNINSPVVRKILLHTSSSLEHLFRNSSPNETKRMLLEGQETS